MKNNQVISVNIEENIGEKEIELGKLSENCIIGNSDYLLPRLKDAFKKATSVDIIVAFLMESGVKLLEKDLKEIITKNIPIRILTGNYLNITEPSALYKLKDIMGDKVDLRFYSETKRSFHPKAYIFQYENGGDIFIGSSNISKSALTYGIEWNYRITKDHSEEDFNYFRTVFEDLFLNHSIIIDDVELKKYSASWIRPKVHKEIENTTDSKEDKIINMFEPRGAQVEAIYELKKSREEGFNKGIVVAATGIGKTYLAAFDSKNFTKVLFVAHREEIIKQAAKSFKNIRPDDTIGFFYGDYKDTSENLIFATVQTLGKEEYLNEDYFKSDYFDYIVIDEFHHAISCNYQNILNYFKPKFLLGLTATPERLDNEDVFSICDYNVVYESRLHTAINKGWLVPFRYYGIYDDSVNYSKIQIKKGKYDEKQLERALMINKRADLILKNYLKYNSKCALGFCSSKEHAEFMADYFNKNHIKACSVYSGKHGENTFNREEAISELTKGNLQIIFSIDMFNEGIDIPAIDLVMFLRPTESPTVFLQQLGRGLRRFRDKKYLNVLDFIGNYKKANLIPFLLSGKNKTYDKNRVSGTQIKEIDYPEDCFVDFDFRLIDIFKKQEEQEKTIKDKIIDEFYRVENKVGHIPTRVEFFKYIDPEVYKMMKKVSKLNVFNDYLSFLKKLGKLNISEELLVESIGHDFIKIIETTSMSKTYKMPVLLAFYNSGNLKLNIDNEDIYINFKEFYSNNSNAIDMLKHKNTKDFKTWNKDKYVKLAKDNPIKFLSKTHSDFFYIHGDKFCLNDELDKYRNDKYFLMHFKDAIDYRTIQYYKNRLEMRESDYENL